MRPDRPTARRGYSLMEMMIVVTLIAIVTAFAMPHVDYQAHRQDGEARAIRGAMQQAQAYAVSSQHNVFVVVDQARGQIVIIQDPADALKYTAPNHYTVVPMENGTQLGSGGAPQLPGGSAVTGGLAMATPTTVNAGLLSTQSTGFVFRADGAVSSAAQIYITSARGSLKDARAISVTQATGRADWYKYVNGSWVAGGF